MIHSPVMLPEVLDLICTKEDGLYLDATFGRGGHTAALLDKLPMCKVIAIDRDPEAIEYGKQFLSAKYGERLQLVLGTFSELENIFREMFKGGSNDILSGILMDLGVSSPQLDTAERGFSFMKDGPLDMRMSNRGKSAADIVNSLPERVLADLFYEYGEETQSRRIAKRIVLERRGKPFKTTTQLANVIKSEIRYDGKCKRHPATKVFQALRIAVNDELLEVESSLPFTTSMLTVGGCIVVISFHSLEDRIVKHFFQSMRKEQNFEISKKPVIPSSQEIKDNPRSRSAKLRYAIRRE